MTLIASFLHEAKRLLFGKFSSKRLNESMRSVHVFDCVSSNRQMWLPTVYSAKLKLSIMKLHNKADDDNPLT